jgi:hypothetical protein
MPTYNYLPGTQINTLDGGMVATVTPSTKLTLIVGTAGTGPANEPYSVTSRATAATVFGLSGSLIRGMEECASAGNDNIVLFRAGTTPATLTGVGVETGGSPTPGFTITFSEVSSTTTTDYSIWYANGVLYVWLSGQLVYANDSAHNVVVDSGNISITGTVAGNTGLLFGTGATGSLSGAITIAAAAAVPTSGGAVHVTLTPPVTGLSLTGRQTYIAIAEALDLLSIYPVDQIFCPDAVLDQPNVAYYVSGTPATAVNNPSTNANALDWLKITSDGEGGNIYQWASETTDSTGATVTAMTAVTAAARITAGFYETNYVNLIGNYCYDQEVVGLNGTVIGFIGTSGPKSFGLVDTRNWVGYLPTFDLINTEEVDISGKGLLGIPILAGCNATSLNFLCTDYAKGYRDPGVFSTNNDLYDGSINYDTNNNPVDIGAYIHVVGDYAVVSNGYLQNYVTNLAGLVAGFHSTLDQKVALTNKPISVIQLWKPNNAQMDSLTEVGINVLRFKGNNSLPALLHGETIANPNSDYINLLRQDIKGLVVETTRQVADGFIGYASTDLLSLSALKTALTNKYLVLQQRGYISSYSFTVTTTQADIRLGHASVNISFVPANELVQLNVTVGISQSSAT